jgi:beta-phosphoglucomutase-like phosphatase (HAD superfamily)
MKKINTIIFDLDGVIVDTKIIHFKSLNHAFRKANVRHQVSFEDHLKYFLYCSKYSK